MRDKSQCSFAGQNLRNRSFARQDLRGADFSGADLRGCDFRKACAIGANFNRARMGRSRFQTGLRLSVILGVAAVTIDAVSRMVFGTLGKTWEDPAWFYVVLLHCVLAGIGVFSAITFFATRPFQQIGQWMTGLLNGMLFGFFYGGYFSNSNPSNATFGAIVGLLSMGLLLRVAIDRPWLKLGVATASASATYGFTFFVGMWAIAAWSTANVLLALGLSGVGASSLWLSGYQLLKLISDLKTLPGTFFQGADLSNTTFEGVILQ
ncbi:pentapeptide repeat-containing protein [Altericista sp. CCNU0014]|uniref:pentapeptide repeat-containing protein n=1 Tax=Altericista sp. CCNU0014 TaxID=3082949 RepID=UPI003850D19E